MAMVKCPECGKDFSDKASCCPNCGCPISAILEMPSDNLLEADTQPNNNSVTERNEHKDDIPFPAAPHIKPSDYFFFAVVAVIIGLCAFWAISSSQGIAWLVLCLTVAFAFLIIIKPEIQYRKEYKLAKEDFEAYKATVRERRKRVEQYEKDARDNCERKDTEEMSKLPACPICGSKEHVRRISTLNRTLSVAAVGLASGKIGKQYQCTHCKHMW